MDGRLSFLGGTKKVLCYKHECLHHKTNSFVFDANRSRNKE